MFSHNITPVTITTSLAIIAAILLSGVHAADLAGLSLPKDHGFKKIAHDDQPATAKSSPDLHNHIDKQTLKSLTNDPAQTDARSLRHLQHGKKDSPRPHPLRQLLGDRFALFIDELSLLQ